MEKKHRRDLKGKINYFYFFLLGYGRTCQTQVACEWQGADPSPLGFAAFCGPRQLGKASDPRLMVPRHDPILFDLASHPTLMGSDCGYTQGFWVSHLRGAQSS